MIEVVITNADVDQRADKYIIRLLPGASKSLIYKQIRKKNITLNGKKMDGSEKLNSGDTLQFFFSDETYVKFQSPEISDEINLVASTAKKAYEELKDISVIYEDDNIILMNKPMGVLSQSAVNNEYSLNEWLIGYLLDKGAATLSSLLSFKPSVLNRLDRNTSGIVIGSKSLIGATKISQMLKDRTGHKYYLTYVSGTLSGSDTLEGYHIKDSNINKVDIKKELDASDNPKDYDHVITRYKVIRNINSNRLGEVSLLEVELVTGKSHQIRAHMASIGHPILGDRKYGDRKLERSLFSLDIKNQMLHAYKIVMPDDLGEAMSNIAGKSFVCKAPAYWRKIDGNMEV